MRDKAWVRAASDQSHAAAGRSAAKRSDNKKTIFMLLWDRCGDGSVLKICTHLWLLLLFPRRVSVVNLLTRVAAAFDFFPPTS